MNGSFSYNGPNPLNVRTKETMLRRAYEEWRTVHGKTTKEGEEEESIAMR